METFSDLQMYCLLSITETYIVFDNDHCLLLTTGTSEQPWDITGKDVTVSDLDQ